MKYGEVKKLLKEATRKDIAQALNNLSSGKASKKEQLIAHHFYQDKVSALNDELAQLCQRRKNFAKEWDKWRRMKMVYKLIHDPTMGGLVSDIEPFSHNKAYIETTKYINEHRRKDKKPIQPDAIRRAYETLKKSKTDEELKAEIDSNLANLLNQAIRRK